MRDDAEQLARCAVIHQAVDGRANLLPVQSEHLPQFAPHRLPKLHIGIGFVPGEALCLRPQVGRKHFGRRDCSANIVPSVLLLEEVGCIIADRVFQPETDAQPRGSELRQPRWNAENDV